MNETDPNKTIVENISVTREAQSKMEAMMLPHAEFMADVRHRFLVSGDFSMRDWTDEQLAVCLIYASHASFAMDVRELSKQLEDASE